MSISPAAPRPPAGSIVHLLGIDPARLRPHERTLLLFAAVVATVAFFVGLSDVKGTYGGIDIRNRVVGARVLAAGFDPYTFHWQPGMPEEWFDPVHRGSVPRVTVPPTVLVLYQPISRLPYRTLRLVHFGLEWAALLATVAVLAGTIPGQRWRVGFVVVAAVFVAFGASWRMHTERGQVYVLHALLLALGSRWGLRANLDSWKAGVMFGLAAALRPSFAPVAVAFLLLGKYRTTAGTFAAGAAVVALSLPWAGVSIWKSYSAMGDLYYRYLSYTDEFPPDKEGPTEAEGFRFGGVIVDADSPSSSFARYYWENRDRLGLPMLDLGKVSKAAVLGITVLMLAAVTVGRGRRSPRVALLFLTTLLVDMEYFLPHRWPYVDVHWLVPLALAVPLFRSPRPVPQAALLYVLLGLVLGNGLYLITHPYTTTLARTYLVASGLTLLAVWAWLRQRDRLLKAAH
jgi:hypothetical protein